jgi:hypothetical protein
MLRKNIKKLLLDEDSLISLLLDFKYDHVEDKRRRSVEVTEAGMDIDLINELMTEFNPYFLDSSDVYEVKLIVTKLNEDPSEMAIGFFHNVSEDEWGNIFDHSWTEVERIPLIFYIAATKKDYTLEMIEKHVQEIDYGFHYNIRSSEDYIEVIKKYNKNLPDDVKLWLELR